MFTDLQTFILNFMISGSAAIISKTLMAPIERAKLILQSQSSSYQILTKQRRAYANLYEIFNRVPREQGVLSLWRGNGVNLIRYFPAQALNFSFYDTFKQNMNCIVNKDTYAKAVVCKLTAGGLAGACSTAIVFPLHFCQTRLCLDIGSGTYKNAVPREFEGLNHCIRSVVKNDGIRGLYNGMFVTVLGIALYRSIYFGVFDVTKKMYNSVPISCEHENKPPLLVLLILAQLVTILSGFLSYPLDTVSRYMMLDSGRPKDMRNSTTFTIACKYIYATHGMTGYYRGALTNVLRSTGSALVLVLYDEFLYYTNWKDKMK